MSTRMHIVVSDELLAKIDASLGPGQARADFVRRAVERALSDPSSSGGGTVPDAVTGVPRSAAPAEQPDDALREVHQELRQESRAEAFRRAAGKKR